jgi:hypothetical protein
MRNIWLAMLLLVVSAAVSADPAASAAPKSYGLLRATSTVGNASAFQCDFQYTLRRGQVLVLECNQPPPQRPGFPIDSYPPESPIKRTATVETGHVAVQGWIAHTYEIYPLAGANAVLHNLSSATVTGRARVTVVRPRPELSIF